MAKVAFRAGHPPLHELALILFDYAGHLARHLGRAWNTSQERHHRNVRALPDPPGFEFLDITLSFSPTRPYRAF
jgi:hypothetical protein